MASRRVGLKFRLAFLLLLSAGFAAAAAGPAREAWEQRQAIEAEERKLQALRSTNAALQRDLARLNDQDYLEMIAREQLGVVRPGEISYIVERPPADPPPKPPPPKPLPWYERAWNWVLARL